ncbi:MAG TPA: methylenetetrahydrofolate reductase [Burkholderiales bacterium]|nr:methylenetetrahydrofolate reductase [Burkholderiales bacterium]
MVQERRAASELQARLRSGQFVITAEITPPVSTDPAEFLRRAMPLKGLATAVNVTDGAGAKVHLSSLATAHFLVQSGIEPIFQMTCRDRNRLALQGDLLGALALGVRNVLVLGGDDPKLGDQPDAKPVFDVNSREMLAMFHRMRTEGALPTGTKIDGPPMRLVLGAAEIPIDPPPGWQPKGLQSKIAAGADFVQTQFCMDIEVVKRYTACVRDAGITAPILIGVAPMPSVRSARWMKEKLFGTIIPDAIIERLEKAADPRREGRNICVEILRELAEIPGVAGAHVMAPMNFAEIPNVIVESGVAGRKLAHAVH